jgi:hypothetical protein
MNDLRHLVNLHLRFVIIASGMLATSGALAQTTRPGDPAQQPPAVNDQSDADAQVLFDSPQDAAVALVEAVRARDRDALRAIIGPNFDRLSSGDLNIDDEDLQRFTAAYDAKNALIDHGNNTYTLTLGLQEWEFPAPIVGLNNKYWFDGEQGVEEVLNRVIGEHELETIAVCQRYPAIQQNYFDLDPDGDGVKSYAMKVRSTEGKRDGLYWPDVEGQPLSPIGPAVATAHRTGELHQNATKPDPYNGYFYRILTKQGPGAPGGARDYVDQTGRMTGGFALIAWPASYDNSGIMTFIVGPDGIVYQRDLGEMSADEAAKITAFDPAGWTRVGADGMPVDAAQPADGSDVEPSK